MEPNNEMEDTHVEVHPHRRNRDKIIIYLEYDGTNDEKYQTIKKNRRENVIKVELKRSEFPE